MTEELGRSRSEFVSEALDDEIQDENNVQASDAIKAAPEPLRLVNYLNVTALLVNLFFPIAIFGFDMLGNSPRGIYQNKFITSIASEANIIWMINFLLQGVFVFMQLTARFRALPMVQMGVSYWYLVATLAQTLWLILLPFINDWGSLTIFIVFWLTLMGLITFQYYAPSDRPVAEYWFLKFPFEFYFAWVTVMLLGEISITLQRQNSSPVVILSVGILSFAIWFGGVIFVLLALTKPFYVIPTIIGLSIASIGSELTNPEDDVKDKYSQDVISAVKYASWILGCLILLITLLRGLWQVFQKCRMNRKSEVDLARDSEADDML